MQGVLLFVSGWFGLLVAGCDQEVPDADSAPALDEFAICEEAPAVTWNNWAEGFFLTWCRGCHSAGAADRHGAPEGLDFDNEEDILFWQSSIRIAVLEAGSMPLGGGVFEDELYLLEVYLDCTLAETVTE